MPAAGAAVTSVRRVQGSYVAQYSDVVGVVANSDQYVMHMGVSNNHQRS